MSEEVPSLVDFVLDMLSNFPLYSNSDYDLAGIYWTSLLEQNGITVPIPPSQALLQVILDLYYDSEMQSFPTREDMCYYVIDKLLRFSDFGLDEDELTDLVDFYLFHEGYVVGMNDIPIILEYRTLNNDYPDVNALYEFNHRRMLMVTDPEAYHAQNKVVVPTSNLDQLEEKEYTPEKDDTVSCGLCQEHMDPHTKIYQLTPCLHIFHSRPDECLITHTIKSWLEQSTKCPLCNTEVNI